jgi:hypothetical protein
MAAALLGKVTVEQALELSQQTAEREMRKGGLQVSWPSCVPQRQNWVGP